MATNNYKPGQILYIKSSGGPWYYISILRCATPVKRSTPIKRMEDETYELQLSWISYRELHTCCDLYVDEDGSECMTFERGNGSLLDLDTSFNEIREATEVEREYLYKALVRRFKDYDLGWANHFTDSSYFDIFDWLCWEFGIDIESLDPRNPSPIEDTINEIQKYIWNSLCKETGNYQEETPAPEMVNKQEFMEKLEKWIRMNTDWLDEYIWDGRNPNYGLWDELKKFMEE